MSRKDSNVVDSLLPDREAIEDYFKAKGKAVPHWAENALVRYWKGLPEERFPILMLRTVRPQLTQLPEAKDLQVLFTRLVAYCEHLDYLPVNDSGHSVAGSRTHEAYLAIWHIYKELERKYKFASVWDLTEPVPELEPWEKLPPTE